MKSLNYYIVEVDLDQPYTRKLGEIEIFSERVGSDYDLKPQEGVVKVGIPNTDIKEGDTIIFSHFASDRTTEYFGNICYCVKPSEVFAVKENDTYEAINRIIATNVYREPKMSGKIFLEATKKEIPQLFKIEAVPQNVTFVKEGQYIYVTANADYWIERLNKFFIVPENVVAIADEEYNITEICNDFNIIKILDEEDGFEKKGHIYVHKQNVTDNFIGEVIESKTYTKGNKYFYKKKQHAKIIIKGEKMQAIRNRQMFVELWYGLKEHRQHKEKFAFIKKTLSLSV